MEKCFVFFPPVFGCTVWHVESLFPEKGSNPFPLQWQCRVLTTGLPGKSHKSFVFFHPFLSLFTLLGLVACLLGGSKGKESASIGDPGSISGSGRAPGEGNGNPLQYSCMENPMDRGAWQATAHRAAKTQTQLSTKQPPPPPRYEIISTKY